MSDYPCPQPATVLAEHNAQRRYRALHPEAADLGRRKAEETLRGFDECAEHGLAMMRAMASFSGGTYVAPTKQELYASLGARLAAGFPRTPVV